MKEAGLQPFGRQALRVHLDIANHRVQLSTPGQRADEWPFSKDRKRIGPFSRRLYALSLAPSFEVLPTFSPCLYALSSLSCCLHALPLFVACLRIQFGGNPQSVSPPQFLHPLPISAHNAANARFHWARHIDDGVQVVGHQAELQNADGRVVFAHHIQLVNNSVAQCRPFYPCQRRRVLRNHQCAKQRLARRHRQCDVIHPGPSPGSSRLLPLPLFMRRHILYCFYSWHPFIPFSWGLSLITTCSPASPLLLLWAATAHRRGCFRQRSGKHLP